MHALKARVNPSCTSSSMHLNGGMTLWQLTCYVHTVDESDVQLDEEIAVTTT